MHLYTCSIILLNVFCLSREGEACNHIAALMYAVSDISEKKKDGLLAPTSEKCKWNNPRKRKLSPKKAQDIKFKKQIWGKENKDVTKAADASSSNSIPSNVKVLNIANFRERLEKRGANNVGWLKNFMPKDSSDVNECSTIPKLNNILFQYKDNVNLKSPECVEVINEHFTKLSLTKEQCDKIECLTRNQSSNPQWKQARSERITASNFGLICKKKESTLPDNVLKTLRGYNPFSSKYTEYGMKHEKAARKTYINKVRKDHPNVSVEECGLIVNPKYPHLGASPDGLVHCPHCDESQGLLEIKCPASLERRMKTPSECAKDPKFYCSLSSDGSVKLKTDHAYYFQVQGQMALSGRSWCDFVVWTCVSCSIERIKFDEQFWGVMTKKLEQFYKDAFLPELFSSRVARGRDLY